MDREMLRRLARTWHGIELSEAEADGIRRFLDSVEPVAERESRRHEFQDEPARYWATLEALAEQH
ncbi:MAG: hypothetical protein FJX68_01920 [Alphaproteobacteria bacterium]|nr:hypothetical protein [Alphaproteobacteria bacterium]